jgi:hypothetical protein
MDDDFSYDDDDSGSNIVLYIILACCLCSLCISSSSSGFWYQEVQNLSDPDIDSKTVCKNYTPFPYDSAVNNCPYNGTACTNYKNKMWCPLNIALVNDDPPGSRSKILKLMTTFSASQQDIFNMSYFNETDHRTPVFLFGTEDLTSLQDCERDFNISGLTPNKNRYIKIISDANLIVLSKSTEKDTTSYYMYVAYDLVITLTTGLSLPEEDENSIQINSLDDFITELDNVRTSFTSSLDDEKVILTDDDFSCENVSLYVRTAGSKGVKREKDAKIMTVYGEGLCFFFDYNNNKLDNICSILLIIIKAIDVNIMQKYFNTIKLKSTMTAFEYFMYITLDNYLYYNNTFKYLILKK